MGESHSTADLILDGQTGSCGGTAGSVFLTRRLRLLDVRDEVVDGIRLAIFTQFRIAWILRSIDPRRQSGVSHQSLGSGSPSALRSDGIIGRHRLLIPLKANLARISKWESSYAPKPLD